MALPGQQLAMCAPIVVILKRPLLSRSLHWCC